MGLQCSLLPGIERRQNHRLEFHERRVCNLSKMLYLIAASIYFSNVL